MPEYNVTVKDVSPLISYSDGWNDGSGPDPLAQNYTGGRFHDTSVQGATATLSFYGTACYFFGAERGNHGRYTVQVDDNQPQTFSGLQPDPGLFQQSLFSQEDLPLGNHTLLITNADANKFVDIDFLVFTTGDGKTDRGTNFTFDDTDTRITYSGNNDWSPQSSSISADLYHNGTFHETTKNQAQATISFEGNAAYIFGGTSKDNGAYSVVVDDGTAVKLNGTSNSQTNFQVLLYYTGTLSSGKHTVVLTNLQDGLALDLDFVTTVTFADSPPAPAGSPPSQVKSKTPIIAGVVSGVCIALLWIAALTWFYIHRKRRRSRGVNAYPGSGNEHGADSSIIPLSDSAETRSDQHLLATEALPMRPMRLKGNGGYSQRPVHEVPNPNPASSGGGTSVSSASNYGTSTAAGSRSPEQPFFSADARVPRRDQRTPAVPRTVSYSGSGELPDSQDITPPAPVSNSSDDNAIRIPLPPSRQQELAAIRMQVPDRPQDWGPINEEDLENLILPPNYQQATQPFHPPPPTSNG